MSNVLSSVNTPSSGHYLYYLLLIVQGLRTERENYNRAEYGDSAPRPQNDRWKRDDEPRGGFSQRGGGAFGRQKSQRHENSDHLPEWATDDPSEVSTGL